MKATIHIDLELLEEAARITGVSDMGTLAKMALEALIERESARQLAFLGETEPDFTTRRRRIT